MAALLLEQVESMQQAAKIGEEPILSLGGRDAIVLPHACKGYSYGLAVGPDFRVFLVKKRSELQEFWPVKVELSQEFLWMRGGDDLWSAWYDVMAYLYNLGLVPAASKVSRIDLCVDTDEFGFFEGDKDRFVTRARKRNTRHEGHTFVGWDFGMGNVISARIYLKSLEVAKHGKTWFHAIWRNHGWDMESPVWRVEFQFRREFLRPIIENEVEVGNLEVDEFLLHLSALWRYCTEWISLRIPDGANQTRWSSDERWSRISTAVFDPVDSRIARSERGRAREEQLDNLLWGVLSSKAALRNVEGIDELVQKVGNELEERKSYIRDWFEERVRVKRVRYGGGEVAP